MVQALAHGLNGDRERLGWLGIAHLKKIVNGSASDSDSCAKMQAFYQTLSMVGASATLAIYSAFL